MDITKSNFKKKFPLIKQAIEECTFLAIDTEMTGNCTNGLHVEYKNHSFDTMEERYQKMCETAKNFLVIQIGLSCFQYQESSKKYTHKDFNFYVFPSQHCPKAPDTFFTCSASSLNFLFANNFDFNKLLGEGISYLTPSQEDSLKSYFKTCYEEQLENLTKQKETQENASPSAVNVPGDHQEFIRDVHKMICAYVESDSKDPLCLPPCSAYRRKLIYQTTMQKYPTGLSLSTTMKEGKVSYITVIKLSDEDKRSQLKKKYDTDLLPTTMKKGKVSHITVIKLSDEDKQLQLKKKYDIYLQDLDDAVGFRKVLDVISKSKKLILGHNMLLDLFHIINQFYFPVPQSLMEFKQMIKSVFPHVADTKTLATVGLKAYSLSTSLFQLWEEIQDRSFPQPTIELCNGFEGYDSNCEKKHEAGYDAFMTAAVFVSLIAKLGEDHKLGYIAPDHKILSPYVNRPYIMRHYDIQFLNLNGPDREGSRDNVFYVTFPKEWKTIDLVELFVPYGEIHVSWLNDCSAFIALKSPEQSVNVKRVLLKDQSSLYQVWSYADYQERHSVFKVPTSVDHKNNQHVNMDGKKKQGNSHSADVMATNHSMAPILEEEEEVENAADKQDNCVSTSHDSTNTPSDGARTGDSPKPKRQKIYGDSDNPEVSSTDKMFEEPDAW